MAERLPSLRPQQVLRVLHHAGFAIHHQTGSHVILYKEGNPRPVTVLRHNRNMKRGIVAGIIADAGLSREEFLELLRE